MAAMDSLKQLWTEASALKRSLMVGVPAVVLPAVIIGGALAASGRGGSSEAQVLAPTATATETALPATATSVPLPTETPASAGLQADAVPPPDAGSHTTDTGATHQPQSGSGPGAAQSTGMSMQISKIGVNASIYSRSVGTNGQMGNPSGPTDVIWHDFSENWPQYGGYPGQPGANAVFAGHVDYIRYGPAVFWSIKDLQAGDQIVVNTPNGSYTYAVDWSDWGDPAADFAPFVQQTGQEIITLVTCIGSFSGGHYSNRLIVRGHRV
jgi:LPXTG-site transpeptidase (sortase) family protein